MKAKIVNCQDVDFWYNELVGKEVEVKEFNSTDYEVVVINDNDPLSDIITFSNLISKNDCEVI